MCRAGDSDSLFCFPGWDGFSLWARVIFVSNYSGSTEPWQMSSSLNQPHICTHQMTSGDKRNYFRVTTRLCNPVAPLGSGGAVCDVCTSPRPSVARTIKVYLPACEGDHSICHNPHE